MESNSQMGRNRPTPSTRRLSNVALLLAGIAFAPACGGESAGAQVAVRFASDTGILLWSSGTGGH